MNPSRLILANILYRVIRLYQLQIVQVCNNIYSFSYVFLTSINSFLNTVLVGDIKPQKNLITGNIKPKSQGTDDGFHGEPALCGKSIVHVANQMMSGKFTKLFASDSRQQPTESSLKNVSKSLPASPLATPTGTPDSSPKARRKMHANRYFSGAFVPDKEKYQGSWILASILGQSREIVTAKIEEEDEIFTDIEPNKPLNRKKSISSQNLTYIGKDEKSADKTAVYVNVPSELREMNCWSPTSM